MSKKFYIYLNLHSNNPKTFSVLNKGIVVDNPQTLTTKGVFCIRQGGHAKAVSEGVKNVHAFVVSSDYDVLNDAQTREFLSDKSNKHGVYNGLTEVSYNHNKGAAFFAKTPNGDYFLNQNTEFPIFLHNHKCYVYTSDVFYHLKTHKGFNTYQTMCAYYKDFDKLFKLAVSDLIRQAKHWINNNKEIDYFDANTGICDNLYELLIQRYDYKDLNGFYINDFTKDEILLNNVSIIVAEFAKTWEHYSGSLTYPIPDPSGQLTPRAFYEKQIHKWGSNPNGMIRLNLLNHINQQVKTGV